MSKPKHQEYAVAFERETSRWVAVHQSLVSFRPFEDHYWRDGCELRARASYYVMPNFAAIARGLGLAEATALAQRENVAMVRERVLVRHFGLE